MSKPALQVTDLGKRFRTRGNKNVMTGLFRPEWQYTDAVSGVSFEVEEGESVAFLGPNGAGKTTTTKMLSGIMHPSQGDVRALGYVPFERDPEYLRRIGLVMGNKSGLNWDLSPRQSYELLKTVYKIDEASFEQQLSKLSKLLDIERLLDRQVRQLSLGERMKAELIGALLHSPEILFLDEPTIGLDIDSKYAMREFLVELRKTSNITILLTSHDMDDIEHVCERVIVINEGTLIFDDSLEKLSRRYADAKYVRLAFDGPTKKTAIGKHGKILDQSEHTYLLSVPKKDLVKATAAFGGMENLADITIESVPLERIVSDLFKKTSGGAA